MHPPDKKEGGLKKNMAFGARFQKRRGNLTIREGGWGEFSEG